MDREPLHLSRRHLLKAGLLGAGGLLLGCAGAPAAGPTARSISSREEHWIDAHVHLWSADLERYPHPPTKDGSPLSPLRFTAHELLRYSLPASVQRAVVVQSPCYGTDNRYLLDVVGSRPDLFRGVALLDEADMNLETVRAMAARGIRGFRLQTHGREAETWTQGPVEALWRACASEGLHVCVLTWPRHLGILDRLCERHPETPVVVDHLGRVGVDGWFPDDEVKALCRLARHPNVAVKASGFHMLGARKPPYTDVLPLLHRAVEAFGPQRVIWGSDSPSQVKHGNSYRAALALVHDAADFLSPDDKAWILGRTAERHFFS